ncbi:MAG: hypothetical protein N5P05_003516 [Chroococcopsis gigantea SAG 12.99]|jgi:putative nucleotidyltransferase with HDIG domain|nr:HDIG domain-containing protein [Chlorogloea purpurea SAG 13.99]MDV3001910.1 hypothetical protein [Chroococcopsis gigantea SAG 12.99]
MSSFVPSSISGKSAKKKRFAPSLLKARRPLIFGFTVACLTSVVGYPLYNQPKLSVGTIAPATIKAPYRASFKDQQTTEELRRKVRTGIIPVLRRNTGATEKIKENLQAMLGEIEQFRGESRQFPIVPTRFLSLETQTYLITANLNHWTELKILYSNSEASSDVLGKIPENILKEINNYQQRVSSSAFENTVGQFEEAREKYAQMWQTSTLKNLDYGLVAHSLSWDQTKWDVTRKASEEALNRILMQGIPPGLPPSHIKETISLQLKNNLPAENQPLAASILERILKDQSNLEQDKEATQQYAAQAMEAVPDVIVSANTNDTIVKGGEKITQAHFALLDGYGLSRREINGTGLAVTGLIVTGAVSIFCLVARKIHRPLRHRDLLLLGLLSFTPPLLNIANIPFTNLAAVGLLTSSFYGPTLAVTQVLLLSGLSGLSQPSLTGNLIAGTVGGLLAACMAAKLRSRDELSLLGGAVGLVQGGAFLITYLVMSATAGTIFYMILPPAALFALSGIAWCIIALGISPYLERIFDVVTQIRLVELANPNCTLLKRLATEAPGTFQHTLFVACLAEAAGRKLYCNVELIRTGTLYHDIGKMHDPKGFIENQMGGPNKHDAIDNPWTSAEIIKKHVSEGLVMAKKYGLPRVVRDFIPEHQGTLLIAYFYHQAQQLAKLDNRIVDENHFCYNGPIPQSRETGIVMLADSCEAALRSLKDATQEQATDMIKKIFQARWRDQQLAASGIKLEELPIIAEVFVQVWQQFHHQRIAYPKAVLESPSREKKSA